MGDNLRLFGKKSSGSIEAQVNEALNPNGMSIADEVAEALRPNGMSIADEVALSLKTGSLE